MNCGAYHRDPAVWVGEAEGTAKVSQRPMFKFMIIKHKMNKCLLKSLYTLRNMLQHYLYKLLSNENSLQIALGQKTIVNNEQLSQGFSFLFFHNDLQLNSTRASPSPSYKKHPY